MRIIITIILVSVFNNLESQNVNEKLKLNDTWFGGELEIGEKKAIIRGRSHLKNFKESEKYNDIVQITWNVENPTDNGIPTPDENISMGKMEDALIESVESDLQSVLAFVQTYDNTRTWFFYSEETEIFMTRLNKTLSKFKELPISIELIEDADWTAYSKVLEDFKIELK